MKLEFLKRLRCPRTGQRLTEEEEGLVSEDGNHRYPIRSEIPRLVPESNYADNFGLQWNQFAKTQLDSYSGQPISSERFWKSTGWNPSELRGKWVLDAGCGSGRFAEIALSAGAHVVALDYSSAVDACWANLKHFPNLHIVQSDIYALPFTAESFYLVYSLGVLQHTPDVARAFAALPPLLVSGGRICVDYYEKSLKSRLLPKYWLRPATKRMDKRRLLDLVQSAVPMLLPISRGIGRIPVLGKLLKRLIPVANFDGELSLSKEQLNEWAVLDTFDWLSPAYDNPQTAKTARQWMEQAGFQEIEVMKVGHLVGRGKKS